MGRARDAVEAAGTGVPGLAERMHAFRSLGGNCEFGFVQRYCGAEPSGLFRFSFTPLDALIDALDTDFARYGAPSDLHLVETETGTYYCQSRCYNIWSNTQQRVGAVDPDALLTREYGRVAHLKRRILEELADGSRIFVRKAEASEDEADLRRLAQAVWRHGPSTLLRVTEAPYESAHGSVRRISDRLLAGHVRRFAPQERAWEVDLEPWIDLCNAAYAADRGIPAASLAAPEPIEAMRFPSHIWEHRGRHRARGLSAFTIPIDPAAFDPAVPYVFSAWVRIPAGASPTRIFAILGRDRMGWCDADLTIRDRWQRVWVAARIDAGQTRPGVGLAIVGERSDGFRSYGWRLHDGPAPDRSTLPPDGAGRSPLRWLAAWWS